MDKVVLLAELRALADGIPDFAVYSPSSRIYLEWLGKAHALIWRWQKVEAISFQITADSLYYDVLRDINVGKLLAILHRAIADLEIQVPELPPQAFGPGAVYDFNKALRDLLASAKKALLIVDPYLDDQVFDDYISTVSPQVVVRLLAREYAPSLAPTVQKFISQMKMTVEIRSSQGIHDRVIFIDDTTCYVLGQSIRHAAKAKPTYLAPLPPDTSKFKKDVYEQIWTAATPI